MGGNHSFDIHTNYISCWMSPTHPAERRLFCFQLIEIDNRDHSFWFPSANTPPPTQQHHWSRAHFPSLNGTISMFIGFRISMYTYIRSVEKAKRIIAIRRPEYGGGRNSLRPIWYRNFVWLCVCDNQTSISVLIIDVTTHTLAYELTHSLTCWQRTEEGKRTANETEKPEIDWLILIRNE